MIRFRRAGGACEGCGRPHGRTIYHLGDGRWWDAATGSWRDGGGQSLRALPTFEELGRLRSTRVVLATAHREHDTANNADRNLMAFCQRCHMNHDRPEAALIEQMGYPRVALSPDWEGSHRYAADADTIDDALPPGRDRRRLQRVLQRRQRRWNEAAQGAGLTAAQVHEAALDEAVLDMADGLLATPARTLEAVVLKLLVLLSTREPGPSAPGTSPWREVRLILSDLRGLAASREALP